MKKRFATACILFVCLVSIFSCANSIDTITANNPTPTVYTVSFNTNGGTSVSSQQITSGDVAILPSTPTKTDYTFAGWYSDSELTVAYDFSTPVTQNITLYAKWTLTTVRYTVIFNSNNGSSVASQTVISGETATKPAAPTKDGYVFAGWYVDSELTDEYDFSSAVTSDITLYAKWTVTVPTDISLTNNTGYVSLYTALEIIRSLHQTVCIFLGQAPALHPTRYI